MVAVAGVSSQRDFFGVGSMKEPESGVFCGVSSHFFPGVTVLGVMAPGVSSQRLRRAAVPVPGVGVASASSQRFRRAAKKGVEGCRSRKRGR